jgi:hypothetical protein
MNKQKRELPPTYGAGSASLGLVLFTLITGSCCTQDETVPQRVKNHQQATDVADRELDGLPPKIKEELCRKLDRITGEVRAIVRMRRLIRRIHPGNPEGGDRAVLDSVQTLREVHHELNLLLHRYMSKLADERHLLSTLVTTHPEGGI